MTHSVDVFNTAKVLSVYQINDLQTASFVFSALNSFLPDIYSNYFTTISNLHTHNLRSKFNLQICSVRTNGRKFAIKNRGASLWNKLPNNIRHLTNLFSFKKQYKLYLMEERL